CFEASEKRSRTLAAPTPTNISTNSEPLIEKKGTPASPATARASSVLPVPGGPTRRMPLGRRAPSRPYSSGDFRNPTISWSSALASSTPATSSKPTLTSVSTYTLALLLPTDSSPPPTPPRCCIRRIIQYQKPMSSAIGSTQPRMSESSVLWTVPVKVTLCFASAAASSGSTRTVTNSRRPLGSGSTSRPRTWFSDTQTSSTLPFSSCSSRAL